MTVQQMIFGLQQRGIVVQAQDDALVITGNIDDLTEQDFALLKDNKTQVLALLGDDEQANKSLNVEGHGAHRQLPVSYIQRSMFLKSLSDKSYVNNVSGAFRLYGEVNEQALSKAISALCRRFDILRTVYQYQDDELIQVVEDYQDEKLPFAVETIDAGQMTKCMQATTSYDFDLSKQWPIKVVLFKSLLEQVFCLTVHGIAADGYSLKYIMTALSEAYQLFCTNIDSSFEMLDSPVFCARQYGVYALKERTYLASDAAVKACQYWVGLLNDAPNCHDFPLEFARPTFLLNELSNVQTAQVDVFKHRIDGQLFSKLKHLAALQNVSVFLLLQAMFAGFVARFSDAQDVVIGSVYAERSQSEFVQSVGAFANKLVFRYQLDGYTDMDQLIATTLLQHRQAGHHQQFPFDKVLEELNIERDEPFNLLAQLQFVLREDVFADFAMVGCDVAVLSNIQKVAKSDLSIEVFVGQDDMKLDWVFNTQLFSRQRIGELLAYFLEFVTHHVEHQFDKVLCFQFDDINTHVACEDNFAPFVSCPELIEQYAFSEPNFIAVQQGDLVLTYAELCIKANAIIAGLQCKGIKQGEAVAVYMAASIEQVIVMYAVMRAGFVYVPLDLNAPEQQLVYIVENCEAKALICSQQLTASAQVCGNTPLALFEQLVSCENATLLELLCSNNAACIVYASDKSSDKTRGVIFSHGSLYYALQANRQVFDFSSQNVMPNLGSKAFEMLLPLISGARVQIVDNKLVSRASHLIETTQDASVIHITASLMSEWLDIVEQTPSLYPNLRLLLVDAQTASMILLTRLKAWRADVMVRVIYGVTESLVSSSYLADEGDDCNNERSSGYRLGKPHPNARYYCLNSFGVPQPVGVPGELYIGGLSLASGYMGLEGLTAEKFVDHKGLNQRLYKTGDRVCLLACGHFEFLGRI